jgi:integrase
VKRKLAKATIQTIIKELSKFFNHARKRKLIADNPASGLSQLYSQAKAKHEIIEPLTREEVPLFLAAVNEHASKHYALFFTAIHTGPRLGELAGLQTGDIDFNGNYLIVQRSIDRVHRKIVPTKTKRIRRVDVSDELAGVLKVHLKEQKEYWLKHPRKKADGTFDTTAPVWLFPNEQGEWPDMANIAERHFHRCMTKAALHRRRPYDLRHSYASLLLTAGAPIAYVSEQMGHANIQLTVKVYRHLQPGANRHWINNLPGATLPAVVATAAHA